MKHILILVVTICNSHYLFAQCSVSKQVGRHSTTYVYNWEKVYLNEDLENGVSEYELSIVLNIDSNSNILPYYMLQCRYTNSGNYVTNECVPRTIVFESPGEKFVSIIALKEDDIPIGKNGLHSRLYSYEISAENVDKLKNSSIKTISFWDKRNKNSVISSPYSDLIKEQVECLAVV